MSKGLHSPTQGVSDVSQVFKDSNILRRNQERSPKTRQIPRVCGYGAFGSGSVATGVLRLFQWEFGIRGPLGIKTLARVQDP